MAENVADTWEELEDSVSKVYCYNCNNQCCDGFRTETENRGFSQKTSDTETAVFGGRDFGFNQKKTNFYVIAMYRLYVIYV